MRSPKGLLFACLLSLPGFAQTDQPTPDAQAAALATRANFALTGGKTVADVTMTGTARWIAGSTDESGPVVLKVRGRGQSRLELNLPSGPRVEVRSQSAAGPTGGWKVGEKKKEEAVHNAWSEPAWFFPAALLSTSASSEVATTYIGAEARGERVRLNNKASDASADMRAVITKLTTTDVYLDPVTSLPAWLSFNLHPDDDYGTDIPIAIKFADYRNVNGIAIPFSIKRYLNNGLVLEISLDGAAVNSGLPDSDFILPQ